MSDGKIRLLEEVVRMQRDLRDGTGTFSLYLSIPFCPTRCYYCSFVSESSPRSFALIPQYVAALCEEIRIAGEISAESRLVLDSIYIGGGTPTTLSADDLSLIIHTVRESFDMRGVREFTVEAGRPDTINEEKLSDLSSLGVTRISINPQTLSDDILRKIGRSHSAADFFEKYEMAKRYGFSSINVDLIAGLDGVSTDDFSRDLERIISLEPENITIHALTAKKSSALKEEPNFHKGAAAASKMVDGAHKFLMEAGYLPYYIYRQKNTLGGLENVGYCRPGKQSLYNIRIMDDTQTIVACGAGSVTKLVDSCRGKIERVFCYKYPAEYLDGFEEMKRRKENLRSFFAKI